MSSRLSSFRSNSARRVSWPVLAVLWALLWHVGTLPWLRAGSGAPPHPGAGTALVIGGVQVPLAWCHGGAGTDATTLSKERPGAKAGALGCVLHCAALDAPMLPSAWAMLAAFLVMAAFGRQTVGRGRPAAERERARARGPPVGDSLAVA